MDTSTYTRTRLAASLSPEIARDAHVLEELAAAVIPAGATDLVLPAGTDDLAVQHIRQRVSSEVRLFATVASPSDIADVVARGFRAVRFSSAAAANGRMLGALPAAIEVIVPVAQLAKGDVRELLSHQRRRDLVMLCDLGVSRADRELVPLAFFRWLQTLGCAVGFADADGRAVLAGAAALLDAALVEIRVGGSAMSPSTFGQLAASIRHAELVRVGVAEHRTPEDVDILDETRQSLAAARAIPRGSVICEEMLRLQSPFGGLGPECLRDVIGKQALYDITEGQFITFGLISA